MAGTTDDTDHALITTGGGDDNTMTDDATNRPPVTRAMNLPALPASPDVRQGLGSDVFDHRYQRRELLGRGGMGEVTSWRDERIGREVAVKKMLPHTVGDATARARFLREARVQGQLEHPAIVPVYDLREDGDGGLSLTMKRVREGARLSAPLVLTWLSFAPFAFFMRVLDWRPMVVMALAIVVISATSAFNVTRARVPPLSQIANFILLGVLCLSAGFVAGPFVMVPTLIATFVAALQSHPSGRIRRAVVLGGCALFLSMVGLEWAGMLPTSYVFVDGAIHIMPVALGFPETATRVLMLGSSLGSILAVGLFISTMRDSLAAAQQRVLVLGWHLRQIVPGASD